MYLKDGDLPRETKDSIHAHVLALGCLRVLRTTAGSHPNSPGKLTLPVHSGAQHTTAQRPREATTGGQRAAKLGHASSQSPTNV